MIKLLYDLASKAKATLEKTKTIAKTALAAVAISSIAVGTQVLAHNEQTKLESPQTVTATINHTDPITVKLVLETNTGKLETIEATPEHPFYALLEPKKNASGIWVNAGELQPNNWLRRANGETGIVKSLEWLTGTKRMYNLSVAKDNTFFVGNGQWLVHNQNQPRYEGPKPTFSVNGAHVPGQPGFRPNKTIQPADAAEVFRTAIPDSATNPRVWWGVNANGQVYRFSVDNNGVAHFSGIDGVGDGTRNMSSYAADRLQERFPNVEIHCR